MSCVQCVTCVLLYLAHGCALMCASVRTQWCKLSQVLCTYVSHVSATSMGQGCIVVWPAVYGDCTPKANTHDLKQACLGWAIRKQHHMQPTLTVRWCLLAAKAAQASRQHMQHRQHRQCRQPASQPMQQAALGSTGSCNAYGGFIPSLLKVSTIMYGVGVATCAMWSA